MAEFGKLNFSVSFNPTSAFPIDARYYFSSLSEATAAAATAEEVGSSNTVYFYGETLAVVESGVATLYTIQPNKTLSKVGGAIEFNENVFLTNADGKLDLYGFAGAVAGAQLTKGTDGKLSWVKPDTTTVEGLSTAVEGLRSDVDALQTTIAEKADKSTVYTKTEIDTKISGVYRYKGTVATYSALPTDAAAGDVYNITAADKAHGIKAGDNVAWDGKEWDVLAGTVDLTGYATTEQLATKVDKVDGSRLMTTAEGDKLAAIAAGAQVNAIDGVSSEFTISDDGKVLSVKAITQSKVTGLTDELAKKVDKETGKGLSSNDFTDELLTKLNGIESGANANVLEVVKMGGTALAISEKGVDIPVSSAESLGVVKSSTAANMVAVKDNGEMEVNSVNVEKLVQTEGDTLILNGGSSI